MSTTDGAAEAANGTPTPKRTRSDKGKKRRDPASAGGALSSVLIAIQDLSKEDSKRVLMTAAMFCGLRFIESTEGTNGKRD